MAQDKRDNRIVLTEDESRNKLLEGARAVYKTVSTTYGPKGQNVLLEKPFGRPLLTRDGVTVARDTYFSDRAKNMGTQLITEASEITNRIAGDGTSATVVLAYNLLKAGNQHIAAGIHPMQVRELLMRDSSVLQEELNKVAKPVKKGQLRQVATISAGDEVLGQLISEAIEHVGTEGGIITEKSHTQDVERVYVDGYYLQVGFEALPVGKKEMQNPAVIVSSRRLTSGQDIIELLNQIAITQKLQQGQIPRVLFVGNIEEAAYNVVVENINRGVIDAIIIKTPPMFGNMGKQLLDDIAIYAGCQPLTDATDMRRFDQSFIGSIDKVIANKNEATLFAQINENVEERIAEIKSQIESETTDAILEKLKERVAKLEGKIAIFRIGAATETAKEEKEFRIEDAIHATRAAATDGVVPGGASTLLDLSQSAEISNVARESLQRTFKKLLENANLPAEVKLEEALKQPSGIGYNLRKGGELVDLVKEGVLDPKLVVEQVIKNAFEAAANILTIGSSLIFENKED